MRRQESVIEMQGSLGLGVYTCLVYTFSTLGGFVRWIADKRCCVLSRLLIATCYVGSNNAVLGWQRQRCTIVFVTIQRNNRLDV
jgi:hypothetical protein